MIGPVKLVEWRRGDGHAPLVVIVCDVKTSFVELEIETDRMARPDFCNRRLLNQFGGILRDGGRGGKQEAGQEEF